jgi:uncharacterized cupin superfamily protein
MLDLVPIKSSVAIDDLAALPSAIGEAVHGGAQPFFRSADGQFDAGVWRATPGDVAITSYPSDELWHIISGEVTFVDASQGEQVFKAGDSFIMPKGYSGTAKIRGDFRKMYAMSPSLRPAD